MEANGSLANKKAAAPGAADARGGAMLRIVVLALAVCLVIVGVIIALRPPASDPPRQATPEGQRVLEMAQGLIRDKQHTPAIDLMRSYINKVDPTDADVLMLLAQTLWDCERYDHAAETLARLEQVAPLKARLWWLKGELARRRDNDPAAYMPLFKKATEQPDSTPDIWARYGLLLMRHDQPAEARVWCQRAYDAGWQDADTLAVLGEAALDTNELPLAQSLLERAVEKDKNNPRLWRLLVQTFRQAGLDDRAIATAQTALQHKGDGGLWLELGQLLEARGETEQAADAFAKAADYWTTQAEASMPAAKLHYDLGQYARAMRYIDQARALRGDTPAILDLLKKIEDARFVAR
ncbi:MAG: tetratricopeptide repeat protein [Phycisphaerae bacterium]|nr:tetratricopeptide repeat protein [Phycisphaerae bacterium]